MPSTTRPRISIVIATRDRCAWLPTAIESAIQALDGDGEVVVVDDASSDETPEFLRSVSSEVVRTIAMDRMSGVAAARNAGVEASRHEWIGFLDDDDELLPDWHMLGDAIADDVGFVSGPAIYARDGAADQVSNGNPVPGCPGRLANLAAGSWIVRRSTFDAVSRFDEALRYGENFELGLRLMPALVTHGLVPEWIEAPVVRVRYRDQAARRQARPDWRLASSERILAVHGESLRSQPDVLAGELRAAGVSSARLQRGVAASRYFLRASRVGGDRQRDVARAIAVLIRPTRRRLWPEADESSAERS